MKRVPDRWDGWANSVQVLNGYSLGRYDDGYYRFQVSDRCAGVLVGLSTSGMPFTFGDPYQPRSLNESLYFRNGFFATAFSGYAVSDWQPYTSDDVFKILRWRNHVFFLKGHERSVVKVDHQYIVLPGEVITHASSSEYGAEVLSAVLYGGGDYVFNAALIRPGERNPDLPDDGYLSSSSGELRFGGYAQQAVDNGRAHGGFNLFGTSHTSNHGRAQGQIPKLHGLTGHGSYDYAEGTLSLTGVAGEEMLSSFNYAGGYIPVLVGAANGRIAQGAIGELQLVGLSQRARRGISQGSLTFQGEAQGRTYAYNWANLALRPPIAYGSTPPNEWIEYYREYGRVRDSYIQRVSIGIVDTAEISEYVVDRSATIVTDRALATEILSPSARRTQDAFSSLVARDRVSGRIRWFVDLSDTGLVRDNVVDAAPFTRVAELAQISDSHSLLRITQVDVSDNLRGAGRLLHGVQQLVEETARLSGAITVSVRTSQRITEQALVGEIVESIHLQIAYVGARGRAKDYTQTLLIARPTVRERGFISGDAVLKSEDIAWTANVANWAMSRYTDFSFNSLTGEFASSHTGLYRRGKQKIQAWFETGDLSLGGPAKKRLEAIYTTVRHGSPMTISIQGDVNGRRTTASYVQMARDASESRVVKTQPGKGFASNYYRLRHAADSEFVVHEAEIVSAETARKI